MRWRVCSDQAAVSADVRHLMDALPPLARVARYSDVRGAKAEDVLPVYAALFERALIGLPGACASLDDDAADGDGRQHEACARRAWTCSNDAGQREEWIGTLRGLVERESIHGLVRGRSARFLLDLGALDEDELQRLARLALSTVTPAPQAGAWVEGVLQGGGLALLHQDGLWQALDGWLSELASEEFIALLPLLRRSFSDFQPPERRQMGEKVKKLRSARRANAERRWRHGADQPGARRPCLAGAGADTWRERHMSASLQNWRRDRTAAPLAARAGRRVGGAR